MSRNPRIAGLVASVVAIALVWALASLVAAPAQPIAGHAFAVDGDTLRIGGTRIRLAGLDAPELDQNCSAADGRPWPCGEQAKAFLVGLVEGKEVTCVPSGRDRYRRLIAHCRTSDRDLGSTLVAAGWAVPEPEYAAAGLGARSTGLGIWTGTFEVPADWRRDHGESGFNLWAWLRSWFE